MKEDELAALIYALCVSRAAMINHSDPSLTESERDTAHVAAVKARLLAQLFLES